MLRKLVKVYHRNTVPQGTVDRVSSKAVENIHKAELPNLHTNGVRCATAGFQKQNRNWDACISDLGLSDSKTPVLSSKFCCLKNEMILANDVINVIRLIF